MKSRFNTHTLFYLCVVLLPFTHCKVDDINPLKQSSGLSPVLIPASGAKNVPVNAMIEIQYPHELELAENQISENQFQIHECESNAFSYFDTAATPNDPKTPATETEKKEETDKTTDKTSTQNPSTDLSQENQEKYKLIKQISFKFFKAKSQANDLFAYLIVTPSEEPSPLKSETTYCVFTTELKNSKGVKIKALTQEFTTEKSKSFSFSSTLEPEWAGKVIAPDIKATASNDTTKKRSKKSTQDYILIHFPGTHIKPAELKKNIHVCMETTVDKQENTETSECRDYGRKVPFEIQQIEAMSSRGPAQTILADYSLFAITPKEKPKDQKNYKIVLNQSANDDKESGSDKNEYEFMVNFDLTSPTWFEEYYSLTNSNNEPLVTDETKNNKQMIYIGTGT